MRRTEVRIRKSETGIEILDPSTLVWRRVTLSERTQLDNRSIPDVQALIDNYMLADRDFLQNNAWDLRIAEQTKIGKELWHCVFGPKVDFDLRSWLHLVPEQADQDDEEFLDFICRVPWAMLTRGAVGEPPFLALNSVDPVAITIDAAPARVPADYNIKLPPAPRLLLVIPEVNPDNPNEDTGGNAHRESLIKVLMPHYRKYGAAENIKSVRSFAEFDNLIRIPDLVTNERFDPHIIYFYGHGATPGGRGTQFQFEKDRGIEDWQSVELVANTIRQMVYRTRNPPFIWYNACLGAAANEDSALRLFAKSASSVVAMRTVVRMDASRELAEKALESIIVDGFSPPVAVREILRNFRSDWMNSGHWASTVIAAQFVDWTAIGREEQEGAAQYDDAVGNFPMRVDRRRPLRGVFERLQESFEVSENDAEPDVVFWSGPSSQSPTIFEERITELLAERFPLRKLIRQKIEIQSGALPGQEPDLMKHLRDSVCRSLSNEPQAPIVDADNSRILRLIANLSPGRSGVLALMHGLLTAADMTAVAACIVLWKQICGTLGSRPNAPRIVLGFGFVEEDGKILDFPKGYAVERLSVVPPPEIKSHLDRYHQLYSIASKDTHKTSLELDEESKGQFKELLTLLERKAGFRAI